MEDQGLRFATWSRSVSPPPLSSASRRSNRPGSEILADLDAVFVLPEARCLHQDDCGETFQFTASMDRNTDGTQRGHLANPTDSTTRRQTDRIKA